MNFIKNSKNSKEDSNTKKNDDYSNSGKQTTDEMTSMFNSLNLGEYTHSPYENKNVNPINDMNPKKNIGNYYGQSQSINNMDQQAFRGGVYPPNYGNTGFDYYKNQYSMYDQNMFMQEQLRMQNEMSPQE